MRIDGQPDTRLLEQRARLEFHYPKEDIIIFIPFFENPEISESKNANLIEYNPLGRAGSLFAYTGAKSRKIKLKATYTLPHLEMFGKSMRVENYRRLLDADSKETQRELFTKWSKQKKGVAVPSPSLEEEKRYVRLMHEDLGMERVIGNARNAEAFSPMRKGALALALAGGISGSVKKDADEFVNMVNLQNKHKVMDTLIFFTNVFRTSVDNDASNPLYGPPLIRLTYGTMYQSIPCICKGVSIEWGGNEYGYDLETLTPRRVIFDLDLVEVRVGDFGTYEPATIVQRDNLAGWESVINSPLTIDPGQLE